MLQTVKPKQKEEKGYVFEAISSVEFCGREYKLHWRIKRVLVADQPAVLGGPKKSLKTTLLVEIVVSLGAGVPFLGHFQVEAPCRVLLISGKSGEAVLQETARRICLARDVDPASVDAYWSFRLPGVGNPADMARLAKGIKDLAPGVVNIDSLYLCLLASGNVREVEAGNLYSMGPLLRDLAAVCLENGATPILAHHARKLGKSYDPLELDDLSFSGISEFSRQWLLVNRRAEYEAGSGHHTLWLSVGGSVGHSGLWGIDADKGQLGEDFRGRK